MNEAVKYLVGGRMDFSSFRNSGCQAKSPMKTIDEIKVVRLNSNNSTSSANSALGIYRQLTTHGITHTIEVFICINELTHNIANMLILLLCIFHDWQDSSDLIIITITARSFMYKMVRNIVGVLVEIGTGRLAPSAIKDIIDGKSRKDQRFAPAPPQG
jgi:tRNA pseudouridine38-40 synthase